VKDKQLSLFARLQSLKPRVKQLTSKKRQGDKAEKIACDYLQSRNLVLVEENYSTRAGEVDLIMRDKSNTETLIFIEVRFRKNADFGGAAASVTPKKQRRIIKAALAYQQQNAPQSSMRFDVVAIEGDNMKLDWITNAFSGF
jgi:putative endonuclease